MNEFYRKKFESEFAQKCSDFKSQFDRKIGEIESKYTTLIKKQQDCKVTELANQAEILKEQFA